MSTETSIVAGVFRTFPMRLVGKMGADVQAQWDDLRHAAAVIGTVFWIGVRPRYWARAVRTAFARQVMVIGVEPLWFVGAVAAFVGLVRGSLTAKGWPKSARMRQ